MSHDDAAMQPGAGEEKHPAASIPSKASRWITIKRGVLWILLAVVGFLLNDAYNAARDWATDKPDYLKALAEQQDKEFAALKESLGQISGSISSGDREAFRQVKNAVSSIEKTNTGLIQQLALAKQENESLRTIASQKADVSGGYDIILPVDAGLRIDSTTTLGLARVTNNGVYINLTSEGEDRTRRAGLGPGDSIAYQNSSGRSCKLSLLSFNDASASFALGCV